MKVITHLTLTILACTHWACSGVVEDDLEEFDDSMIDEATDPAGESEADTAQANALSAGVYYVATDGSDSNPGTKTSPFRTVAFAVKKMGRGDTTYVRGGTYHEKLITFRNSGTASSPIKLLNAPGETPIVDFGVTASNRLVHRFEFADRGVGYVTIEGFDIRHGYEGIKLNDANNITIRGNSITKSIGQCILGRGVNFVIDRNLLTYCGDSKLDHGMYLTGSDHVITNNVVYGCATHGIQVAGYLWEGSGHYKPVKGNAPDRRYAGASNFLIANNTLAYNGAAAIVIWQSEAENNRVVNNIFYENGVNRQSNSANAVNFLNSGRGNRIDNNIFYASGSGATRLTANGTEGVQYTESGNISVNPNFVRAGPVLSGTPDFDLRSGSAAINKGLSIRKSKISFNRVTRPDGAYDIGAYQSK